MCGKRWLGARMMHCLAKSPQVPDAMCTMHMVSVLCNHEVQHQRRAAASSRAYNVLSVYCKPTCWRQALHSCMVICLHARRATATGM
jgi:hypothetical protein